MLVLTLWFSAAACLQVNDEGYTPLMEAAREGHEEMVALLLAQGKDVLCISGFIFCKQPSSVSLFISVK